MGLIKTVLFAVLVAGIALGVYHGIVKDYDLSRVPDNTNTFWGPKALSSAKQDESVRPFKISIGQDILKDLKSRLSIELGIGAGGRLRTPLEDTGFEYGFNTGFLTTVGKHWLEKYDWSKREAEMNKWPHFKTIINGLDMHFIHVKGQAAGGKYKKTVPLLLLHGWPGSFVEFLKIIPMLNLPENSDVSFELVIPSLPGYGFSEGAHKPGLGALEMCPLFLKLMKRLGHDQFYVQGGDWGSLIASSMGMLYPNNVKAIHINMCVNNHPLSTVQLLLSTFAPTLFVPEEHVSRYYPVGKFFMNLIVESGYFHLQGTKPDTVGVALSNSPLGLAAYLLEKFSSWTDMNWREKRDGGLVNYNMDDLLDNVMVYWVTNSITTSMRLYAETLSLKQQEAGVDRIPVKVPMACYATPNELMNTPEPFLKSKYPMLSKYTIAKEGGHFAAFEVPKQLAQDVVDFISKLEKS